MIHNQSRVTEGGELETAGPKLRSRYSMETRRNRCVAASVRGWPPRCSRAPVTDRQRSGATTTREKRKSPNNAGGVHRFYRQRNAKPYSAEARIRRHSMV